MTKFKMMAFRGIQVALSTYISTSSRAFSWSSRVCNEPTCIVYIISLVVFGRLFGIDIVRKR